MLPRESKAARSHAREQVEKNAHIKRGWDRLGYQLLTIVVQSTNSLTLTPPFLGKGESRLAGETRQAEQNDRHVC